MKTINLQSNNKCLQWVISLGRSIRSYLRTFSQMHNLNIFEEVWYLFSLYSDSLPMWLCIMIILFRALITFYKINAVYLPSSFSKNWTFSISRPNQTNNLKFFACFSIWAELSDFFNIYLNKQKRKMEMEKKQQIIYKSKWDVKNKNFLILITIMVTLRLFS